MQYDPKTKQVILSKDEFMGYYNEWEKFHKDQQEIKTLLKNPNPTLQTILQKLKVMYKNLEKGIVVPDTTSHKPNLLKELNAYLGDLKKIIQNPIEPVVKSSTTSGELQKRPEIQAQFTRVDQNFIKEIKELLKHLYFNDKLFKTFLPYRENHKIFKPPKTVSIPLDQALQACIISKRLAKHVAMYDTIHPIPTKDPPSLPERDLPSENPPGG